MRSMFLSSTVLPVFAANNDQGSAPSAEDLIGSTAEFQEVVKPEVDTGEDPIAALHKEMEGKNEGKGETTPAPKVIDLSHYETGVKSAKDFDAKIRELLPQASEEITRAATNATAILTEIAADYLVLANIRHVFTRKDKTTKQDVQVTYDLHDDKARGEIRRDLIARLEDEDFSEQEQGLEKRFGLKSFGSFNSTLDNAITYAVLVCTGNAEFAYTPIAPRLHVDAVVISVEEFQALEEEEQDNHMRCVAVPQNRVWRETIIKRANRPESRTVNKDEKLMPLSLRDARTLYGEAVGAFKAKIGPDGWIAAPKDTRAARQRNGNNKPVMTASTLANVYGMATEPKVQKDKNGNPVMVKDPENKDKTIPKIVPGQFENKLDWNLAASAVRTANAVIARVFAETKGMKISKDFADAMTNLCNTVAENWSVNEDDELTVRNPDSNKWRAVTILTEDAPKEREDVKEKAAA